MSKTYITLDSHQIFPELVMSKIKNTICKSDNPKTNLFLKENPHLIDEIYLNNNINDWSVKFLIENPQFILKNYFSQNTNDLAVKFHIKNPQYICEKYFSLNTNDLGCY